MLCLPQLKGFSTTRPSSASAEQWWVFYRGYSVVFQGLFSLTWGWKVSTQAALQSRTPEWEQLQHDCRVTREEETCDISSKEMRNTINCRGKAINHSEDLESP